MPRVTDEQIAGVVSDGTEAGVVRVATVRSGLVPVPWRSTEYSTNSSGASVSLNSDTLGHWETGQANLFASLTSATGAYVTIKVRFYGRAFGIVGNPSGTYGWTNVRVLIDGAAYSLPTHRTQFDLGTAIAQPNPHAAYIVADDLEDGEHQAEIVCLGNGLAQSFNLYGYLCEARAGYVPLPPSAILVGAALLSAATRTLLSTFATSYRLWTQIQASNVTGTAATLTIDRNSVTIWRAEIPANGTAALTFPIPTALNAGLVGLTAGTANAIQVAAFGVL
jgi:hypothetical protein